MKPTINRRRHAARDPWQLRLYVAGSAPRAIAALANLKQLCDHYLEGNYRLEIIDVLKKPALAKACQIVAIPTLVRTFPTPPRRLVGDLSNLQRTLQALDLSPTHTL